jgi:hypothetical protein
MTIYRSHRGSENKQENPAPITCRSRVLPIQTLILEERKEEDAEQNKAVGSYSRCFMFGLGCGGNSF